MRHAPLAAFLVSLALALFAFMVFQGAGDAASGARHWAAAPLTAVCIVLSGGGLVVLAGGRGRPR